MDIYTKSVCASSRLEVRPFFALSQEELEQMHEIGSVKHKTFNNHISRPSNFGEKLPSDETFDKKNAEGSPSTPAGKISLMKGNPGSESVPVIGDQFRKYSCFFL